MSSPMLIIRHAKRAGETSLNLSGMDLKELPQELLGLGTTLEVLNLSKNKISSLEGIQSLSNLRELNLSTNLIKKLPKGMLKCTKLKLLNLSKNPIATEYPFFAECKNEDIQSSFDQYFGELEYMEEPDIKENEEKEEIKENIGNMNVEQLRKLVNELQAEMKTVKLGIDPGKGKSGVLLRPQTREQMKEQIHVAVENDLEIEKAKSKKLEAQIEQLSNELLKARSEKCFGAGMSLESIQGVTEIDYNELQIDEEIGKGGFANIYKGRWRGSLVAIKRLFDPNVTESQMEEVRNEIVTMATLRHPKITLLMGICRKPPDICIVMECCKISLFTLLHKTTTDVQMNGRLKIARDVANAYLFLHQAGIVHRDLKSHNILLTENYQIKLCDFGLAKYKSDLNKGTMQYSGTPAYMAPELFQKRSYDEKIDVFAFGTLLWEIVSRQVPFEGLEPDQIKKKIASPGSLTIPYNCPPDIGNLITSCRGNIPEKRPSFAEIHEILDKQVT